jgi:hypothetical protein
MKAYELLVNLVKDDLCLPPDHQIELIRHGVGVNWRQRFRTPREQIGALDESVSHHGPFYGDRVSISDLAPTLANRAGVSSSALSVVSRVWDVRGKQVGHLALMNLHPVGFASADELRQAIDRVTNGLPGYLVSSGRYFHYYGIQLLSSEDWLRFLAQFLMPCVLVSPRYIGHSVYRGFCALRLNSVPPHKAALPTLYDDEIRRLEVIKQYRRGILRQESLSAREFDPSSRPPDSVHDPVDCATAKPEVPEAR